MVIYNFDNKILDKKLTNSTFVLKMPLFHFIREKKEKKKSIKYYKSFEIKCFFLLVNCRKKWYNKTIFCVSYRLV